MNTLYPTLVRRELWEHRVLWLTPAIVAALILLVTILAAMAGSVHFGLDIRLPPSVQDQQKFFVYTTWAITAPHYLVMVVVLFFYLLDSLYTERRDRSILFWKSMPVSDAATVLSKLLVAAVLVPLAVYVTAIITDLLVSVIWTARVGTGRAVSLWDTGMWFRMHTAILAALILTMLWYLPIMGYLLLVSAWAKRNAFLWAVLPPLLIMLIEAMVLDTHYARTFLAYRLDSVVDQMSTTSGEIPNPFRGFSVVPVLTNADLWLGLVAAAGLVYAAIYVRRYRDDT